MAFTPILLFGGSVLASTVSLVRYTPKILAHKIKKGGRLWIQKIVWVDVTVIYLVVQF
jgi:hypothetical protein